METHKANPPAGIYMIQPTKLASKLENSAPN